MRSNDGHPAALILPAKRWRRRLTSLRQAYPEPVTIPGVDPTLLTPDERWEIGRVMAIVEQEGLAGCSDWELDLLICCQRKLDGSSTGICLKEWE